MLRTTSKDKFKKRYADDYKSLENHFNLEALTSDKLVLDLTSMLENGLQISKVKQDGSLVPVRLCIDRFHSQIIWTYEFGKDRVEKHIELTHIKVIRPGDLFSKNNTLGVPQSATQLQSQYKKGHKVGHLPVQAPPTALKQCLHENHDGFKLGSSDKLSTKSTISAPEKETPHNNIKSANKYHKERYLTSHKTLPVGSLSQLAKSDLSPPLLKTETLANVVAYDDYNREQRILILYGSSPMEVKTLTIDVTRSACSTETWLKVFELLIAASSHMKESRHFWLKNAYIKLVNSGTEDGILVKELINYFGKSEKLKISNYLKKNKLIAQPDAYKFEFFKKYFLFRSLFTTANNSINNGKYNQYTIPERVLGKGLESQNAAALPIKKQSLVLPPDKFTLDDFLALYDVVNHREDISSIYYEHAMHYAHHNNSSITRKISAHLFTNQTPKELDRFKEKHYWDLNIFHRFLTQTQHESYDPEEIQQLIKKYEPSPYYRDKNWLSLEGFVNYMMSYHGNILSLGEQKIYMNMEKPINQYYINSSHNTYLTGHQLTSVSSTLMYVKILLAGCRCVELDCWDGEDNEPIITHGHTLCSKIKFIDTIKAINDWAFITSPYPVILSLENHCSILQQDKIASYMKFVFKEALVTDWIDGMEPSTTMPSPEALKYRILIKNRKLGISQSQPHHPNMSSSTNNSMTRDRSLTLLRSGTFNSSNEKQLSANRNYAHGNDVSSNQNQSLLYSIPNQFMKKDNNYNNNSTVSSNSTSKKTAKQNIPINYSGVDLQNVSTPEKKASKLKHKHKLSISSTTNMKTSIIQQHDTLSNTSKLSASALPKHDTSSNPISIHMKKSIEKKVSHIVQATSIPANVNINRGTQLNISLLEKLSTSTPIKDNIKKEKQKQKLLIEDIFTDSNDNNKVGYIHQYVRTPVLKNLILDTNGINKDIEEPTTVQSNSEFIYGDDFDFDYNMFQPIQVVPPSDLLINPISHLVNKPADKQSSSKLSIHSTPISREKLIKKYKVITHTDPMKSPKLVPVDLNNLSSLNTKESKSLNNISHKKNKLSAAANNYKDGNEYSVDLPIINLVDSFNQLTVKSETAIAQPTETLLDTTLQLKNNIHSNPESKIIEDSIANITFIPSTEHILDTPLLESHIKKSDYHVTSNTIHEPALIDVKQSFKEQLLYNGQTIVSNPQVSKKLSAMINYFEAVTFKSFSSALKKSKIYQMSSFEERKCKNYIKTQSKDFVGYCTRHVARVYPATTRIESGNYNPVAMWSVGIQMAALNFQTSGVAMQLNFGKFMVNGNCGYLLKPKILRTNMRFDPYQPGILDQIVPKKLKIQIISGQFLSNQKISPYVEFSIHGIPRDKCCIKTRVVSNNGFNPVFDEEIQCTVTVPEIAMVRFAVFDVTGRTLAYFTIPYVNLSKGYRHVPLYDIQNRLITLSTLFIHIDEEDDIIHQHLDLLNSILYPKLSSNAIFEGFVDNYSPETINKDKIEAGKEVDKKEFSLTSDKYGKIFGGCIIGNNPNINLFYGSKDNVITEKSVPKSRFFHSTRRK